MRLAVRASSSFAGMALSSAPPDTVDGGGPNPPPCGSISFPRSLFGLDPAFSSKTGPNASLLGPSSTKSFKDALSGIVSSSDPKIDFVHTTFNGLPAVMCSDKDIEKMAEPYAFSLVRKFSYHRPKLEDIRKFFFSLKLTGVFSVGLLDARHILIKLANDLDYSRVFSRRSYYVLNCQMRLLKWTPYFDIKEESPNPYLDFSSGHSCAFHQSSSSLCYC